MTTKQKVAIAETVKNGGNISEAMRKAGYAEATIHNPDNLTKSKSFQQAMLEAGITDDTLTEVLHGGLKASKWNDFTGENAPDHATRHKYLETALRLNGYTSPDNPGGNTYNTQINISDNTPRGKQLVDNFTEYMKKQTLPNDGN